MKTKQKEDTLYSISMRSNSIDSMDKKSSSSLQQIQPRLDQLKVTPRINQQTRNIAALAAAKKRRQQQGEGVRQDLNDGSQLNRTFISTYGGDDNETRLTPSRLASHNLKYGLKYSSNDDNDSLTAAEQKSMQTDPAAYQMDNSPAARGRQATTKPTRTTKYRPQPLTNNTSTTNAASGQAVGSSSTSDKAVEISNKVGYPVVLSYSAHYCTVILSWHN